MSTSDTSPIIIPQDSEGMRDLVVEMKSGQQTVDQMIVIFQQMSRNAFRSEQIAGAVNAIKPSSPSTALEGNPIDNCSTGGSGLKTFNTSTASAFLLAAAGYKVAKSGNRSASGNSGSMDVMEELGANVDLNPEREQAIYSETGLLMRFPKSNSGISSQSEVADARREYGRNTIFNCVGPLLNMTGAPNKIIGVGQRGHTLPIAEAAKLTGIQCGKVITGHDGLDELTVCRKSDIIDIGTGSKTELDPCSLGIALANHTDIEGGTPEENAELMLKISRGGVKSAIVDLILLNTAVAITVVDSEKDMRVAYDTAAETLTFGKMYEVMQRYIDLTNEE